MIWTWPHSLRVPKMACECVFSKPVLIPGLLYLLEFGAFHHFLRNDTCCGPKLLDFTGLFPQPKNLNPVDQRLTSILALFPREGTVSRESVLRFDRGI